MKKLHLTTYGKNTIELWNEVVGLDAQGCLSGIDSTLIDSALETEDIDKLGWALDGLYLGTRNGEIEMHFNEVKCVSCGDWYDPAAEPNEVGEGGQYICSDCWSEEEGRE